MRGAKVGMVDLGTRGFDLSKEFNAKYGVNRTMFITCDVRNKSAVADAFSRVSTSLGPLDIVFNNAGIAGSWLDDYEAVIDINLTAVVQGTKLAIEAMQGVYVSCACLRACDTVCYGFF